VRTCARATGWQATSGKAVAQAHDILHSVCVTDTVMALVRVGRLFVLQQLMCGAQEQYCITPCFLNGAEEIPDRRQSGVRYSIIYDYSFPRAMVSLAHDWKKNTKL
jgi:hypothetical protein